ncbi:MAG: carotenoid oxygenase family protein [Burkholderiaceae bacterium]
MKTDFSPTVTDLSRRRLLTGSTTIAAGLGARGLAAGAGAIPASLLSGLFPALLPASAAARKAGADGSALEAWPAAFADVPEAYGPTEVRWSKPLPEGLSGVLYRNGPARMHRGTTSYRHWFDGDGMMQSFRFDGSTLRHQARMIRTDKYVHEEKAGRFLRSAFGTTIPGAPPPERPDVNNVANISVLPVGGELLALWEAGSPWRIDPATLETRGRKVWSPETDGVAFSAHPKVDRDGTIWSFGYLAATGKLVLYRLDPGGGLRAARIVETADADMIHDFAITDRWLVFVLMPLVFDRERIRGDGSFMTHYRWEGERAGTVLLVDKHSLAVGHRIEIPATPFFHVGNAWDDGDAVRVQVMRIAGFDLLMDRIVAAMEGRAEAQDTHVGPVEIVVSPGRGQGSVTRLGDRGAEFPAIDPRYIARRTRSLFVCGRSDSLPQGLFGLNAVARIDRESGRMQRFDYGADVLAEEHLFVARAGAPEGSGWLVGTALDYVRRQTLVSVFDARAVEAGPLTQARLPYGLPLGLHGTYVAA